MRKDTVAALTSPLYHIITAAVILALIITVALAMAIVWAFDQIIKHLTIL